MPKQHVILIVALCCATVVNSKDERIEKDVKEEQPSFMSKVASWLMPFGADSEVAEDKISAEYGAPPANKKNCNPCNKIPWIPVAANYGQNTIIGFVQPHQIGNQGQLYNLNQLQPPLPLNSYGPPHQTYGIPQIAYGPPKPIPTKPDFGPPSNQYGPPPEQYGSPPRPPAPESQHPEYYGPPPSRSPPPDQYGPPPSRDPPPQQYGPPPQRSPPGQQYGPSPSRRPPAQQYGPPPSQSPPSQYYGPPPKQYIPPKQHGAPPQQQYGVPPIRYGPPVYIPVKLKPPTKYGPPPKSPNRFVPVTGLNIPPPISTPTAFYGPPQILRTQSLPAINYGPPSFVQSSQLPSQQAKPVDSYGPPPSGLVPEHTLKNHEHTYLPPRSYLPHAEQNFQNAKIKAQVTNSDYLPPPEQLPLSSLIREELQPIPFPNLATRPVAPLHNPQRFRESFQRQHHYKDDDVQILPSVPVADFLASVEHPINIIHSPLLEVNVTSEYNYESTNSHETVTEDYNLSHNPIVVDDVHTAATNLNSTIDNDSLGNVGPPLSTAFINQLINGGPINDYDNFEGNLSKQPIIVSEAEDYKHDAIDTGINIQPIGSPQPFIGSTGFDLPIVESSNFNQPIFAALHQQFVDSAAINHELISTSDIVSSFQNQLVTDFPEHNFGFSNNQESSTVGPTPPKSYKIVESDHRPSTLMAPPPPGVSPWLTTLGNNGKLISQTTKKPKQVQIIIPYTTNQNNKGLKAMESPIPMYTQLPKTESVWVEHTRNDIYRGSESQEVSVTNKPTTEVVNIKNWFTSTQDEISNKYSNLPFDVIRFQKNIDGWTEQEYANKMRQYYKITTTGRQAQSKKIPEEFFTTLPYNVTDNEIVSTENPKAIFDHEPAGSNSNEYKAEVDSNFIPASTASVPFKVTNDVETTIQSKGTKKYDKIRPNWDKIHISVSPLTKEKVYVVTPLPKLEDSTFSAKLLQKKNGSDDGDIRIVLSEWPHLINNLATTTATATTSPGPKSSRHPLFGLMDLSSYSPPENATIHTYTGHSKVINTGKQTVSLPSTTATAATTTTAAIANSYAPTGSTTLGKT